jgi:hypothetical protein
MLTNISLVDTQNKGLTMRHYNLLEGQNSKCIVVDVQPAYTTDLPWIDDMMGWLNKQGPVLMFVNAENDGLTDDTIPAIQEYWQESGYADQSWNKTEVVDKGYGYFRGWMDQGVSDNAIIQAIRVMYQQKVTDSRELFGGDDSEHYVEQMAALGIPEEVLDDALSVEWTSVGQLKKYNGAYIMGGGRDECLREVELLMNAFNIKYKRVEDFVYG